MNASSFQILVGKEEMASHWIQSLWRKKEIMQQFDFGLQYRALLL